MPGIRLFVAVLMAVGLAGCFTADAPLFDDDSAATPYERISFTTGDEAGTLERQGASYLAVSEDEPLHVRFMQLDRPNVYVVEMSGEGDEGETLRLYGILRVDAAAGTADLFNAIADQGDVGPGLRACEDDTICVDNLDAFVALGLAAIDAGEDPALTYQFTAE